ncbi:MAG: hypothetical protein AB1634_08205 [Thermodesulfobacteriota bacterium]
MLAMRIFRLVLVWILALFNLPELSSANDDIASVSSHETSDVCAEFISRVREDPDSITCDYAVTLLNGQPNGDILDPLILRIVAECHFRSARYGDAIRLLKMSLREDFHCLPSRPRKKILILDEAGVHFQLSEIYSVLSRIDDAKREELVALEMARAVYPEETPMELIYRKGLQPKSLVERRKLGIPLWSIVVPE